MPAVIGILLVGESLWTALWVAAHAATLMVYDWVALAVIAARAGVAVLQFASGGMLLRRQPMGRTFGRWAFVSSAALIIPEIGFGLAPSNLFPSYRWPVVGAYLVYAVAAWALLRSRE